MMDPRHQYGLEVALVAFVLLDPSLLARRRRPCVGLPARLLIESIERRPPILFPESLDIDPDALPEAVWRDVRALAYAVGMLRVYQLDALGPVDEVLRLLKAEPLKRRRTRADVEADIADPSAGERQPKARAIA